MNVEIKTPRMPTEAAARKRVPMAAGLLDYFPDALAAVADVSRIGNEQHNPGKPLQWTRGVSTDHADCILRHMVDRGTLDTDGARHSAKVAWRALALLQMEIERDQEVEVAAPAAAPIVLCDVDEVVAELLTEWISRYNEQWKDELSLAEITGWDLRQFVRPECGERIYEIHDEQDIYTRVDEVPGAREGIAALREAGYRVVFVTSSSAATAGQKLQWLAERGFLGGTHKQTDVVTAYDKGLIRGDLLIDDGLHNVEAFDGPTVLFDRPWNRASDHPARARDWQEVVELVKQILPIS